MNNITAKVSVVVPVYNAEKYLSECIDSILDQSFRDFELILVDDGSKDTSGQICDEFALRDSRVRVFHQQNSGVTAARCKGVSESQTEWITFVDADDKLEKKGLEILVEVVDQDAEFDIVEGSYSWFYPDGTVKSRYNRTQKEGRQVYDGHRYAYALCDEYGPSRGPWSKLIRKNILMTGKVMNIPRWITNREDMIMLTNCAVFIRKHIFIPNNVYFYRQQFGITAISNKLSFDYWNNYLVFFREKVITEGMDWDDVWLATIKDVWGFIVHGGNIVTGKMPLFFEQKVLPCLQRQKHLLHTTDHIYVYVLTIPSILRCPICIVLHCIFVLKKRLLGKYFSLRVRK